MYLQLAFISVSSPIDYITSVLWKDVEMTPTNQTFTLEKSENSTICRIRNNGIIME